LLITLAPLFYRSHFNFSGFPSVTAVTTQFRHGTFHLYTALYLKISLSGKSDFSFIQIKKRVVAVPLSKYVKTLSF